MKRTLQVCLMLAMVAGLIGNAANAQEKEKPVVTVKTSMGSFEVELYADKAPISVENFLTYVKGGAYDGTIFHRVIKGFMIQGGGFTPDMKQKKSGAQIKNEAKNGLKNEIGTLAMARTNVVDSATNQFFINTKDNDFLNYRNDANYGYAVFGKVTDGMDVVRKIESVSTTTKGGHADVPATPVIIESITVNEAAE